VHPHFGCVDFLLFDRVQDCLKRQFLAVEPAQVNYWEIIAGNVSKAGWSWGWVSAGDSRGRTIFVADAHRDDGKRFVVRPDEKLTAFLELESQLAAKGIACFASVAGCTTKVPYTAVGSAGKFIHDYVIRRFNASSARAEDTGGAEHSLRHRLARFPDPTGAPSQPK